MNDIGQAAGLLVFFAWFGLTVWVGLTADRRGYSGLLWYGLGVLLSPIVSLALLALITKRGDPPRHV